MKHRTNLFTSAVCALIAALAFGCGNALDRDENRWGGETTYEVEGVSRSCDPIDEREDAIAQDPASNWQPGCRKFQRMVDVAVGDFEGGQFPDEDLLEDTPGPDSGGDYGSAAQPITIGTGAATQVNLNANGKILSWVGACRPRSSGAPISCIVPNKVNFAWEVCPEAICGRQVSDTAYIRDRFRAAWTVWRNANSTLANCGGVGIIPTADTARAFFQNFPRVTGNDDIDAYNFSTLPIFFEDIENQGSFAARTHIFGEMKPFSQVIANTRYYHFDAAGVIVDELTFESTSAFGCGVTIPQLGFTAFSNALGRGYERIIAHELGHVRGLPHVGTGIMRPGTKQSCGEVFQLPQPSALPIGDTAAKARIVVGSNATMAAVQSMRDSNGVNLVSSGNTQCVEAFTADSNNTADFSAD